MREIWCHMFKAGFKSLRGIKIIKVFSLLLAVLWKNYKWLNHLCWSETTVGKWKESGFLSTKQGRKRLHYHSVSQKRNALPASDPRPQAIGGSLERSMSNVQESELEKGFPNLADDHNPLECFLKGTDFQAPPWKFWFSRCRLESRNMNANTCSYVGALWSTRTGGQSLAHTFYRWVDWGLASIIGRLIPILKVRWG